MKDNRIRAVFMCGLLALCAGLVSVTHTGRPAVFTAQVISTTGTLSTNLYTTPTPPPPEPPPTGTGGDDSTGTAGSVPPTTTVVTSTVQDEYRGCPFPQEPNRITVDFTKGTTYPTRLLVIRANGSLADARHTLPVSVPQGIYRVESASYSSLHDSGTLASGPGSGQRWYGVLLDAAGATLGETPTTHDPDPGELVKEILDDSFEVSDTIYSVHAQHDVYPSQTAHAVMPLCISFVRIGSVEQSNQATTNTLTTGTTDASTSTAVSTLSEPVTCPIPARTGRSIVDFTHGGSRSYDALVLYAHGTKDAAATDERNITLPAGTYEVRYASLVQATTRTPYEFWRGVLTDSTGGTIALPPSREVPDWESEYVAKLEQPVTITRETRRIVGIHGAYPNTTGSPIAPLCISFERLSDSAVPVPSSTTEIQTPASIPPSAVVAVPYATDIPDTFQPTVTVQSPVEGGEDDAPASHVIVRSDDVGIRDGFEKLTVPEEVASRRAAFVKEYQQTPFDTLHDASPAERARLVATFRGTAEEASTTPILIRQLKEVHEQPVAETERDTAEADSVLRRGGLVAIRDRDGDGVSDYDEEHFYDTDPDNAFTAGDVFSDGERLILGLDPTTTDDTPVPVESPRDAGTTAPHLFTVESIHMGTAEPDDVTPYQSTQPTPITIVGTGQPLTFLTLYIFSTPIIITVRTDASGRFEYTLDETLSDGSHELYVANVNNSGKVLAKSQPLPFIKTAQAIEYTPPTALNTDPAQGSLQYLLTFGLLAALLVAVGTITWIGMYRVRREDDGVAQNTNETGTL